jgi:GntR family transcriptional regulator, transcriptional repressor for pyruvate dehydrogenase complex
MTSTERLPDERLRIPRAADVVADHLRRQIVRGELAVGRSLPPEEHLTARFGVSGPTLRAAYRVLESEGLISVHRGARGGATVHRPSLTVASRHVGLFLQVEGTTLVDLFEARVLLEPPLAGVVAARADKSMITELRALVAIEAASLNDAISFAHATSVFHKRLVHMAGNRTVETLLTLLWELFEQHATDAMQTDTPQRQVRRAAQLAHHHITDLIEAGDTEAAEDFWRTHMRAVGRLFAQRYGSRTVYELLG